MTSIRQTSLFTKPVIKACSYLASTAKKIVSKLKDLVWVGQSQHTFTHAEKNLMKNALETKEKLRAQLKSKQVNARKINLLQSKMNELISGRTSGTTAKIESLRDKKRTVLKQIQARKAVCEQESKPWEEDSAMQQLKKEIRKIKLDIKIAENNITRQEIREIEQISG